MTVLQTWIIEKQPTYLQPTFSSRRKNTWRNDQYLNSPYVTVLHPKRQPDHNLMYTVHHTFSYHSKIFIRTCTKSSAQSHGTKFRGRNFKHFKISVRRIRKGQFATDSQGCIQMPNSDPRTGTFNQNYGG